MGSIHRPNQEKQNQPWTLQVTCGCLWWTRNPKSCWHCVQRTFSRPKNIKKYHCRPNQSWNQKTITRNQKIKRPRGKSSKKHTNEEPWPLLQSKPTCHNTQPKTTTIPSFSLPTTKYKPSPTTKPYQSKQICIIFFPLNESATQSAKTKKRSRRIQQRFQKKQQRLKQQQLEQEIKQTEIVLNNTIKQSVHFLQSQIRNCFGFLAIPNLTPLHNASLALQSLPFWYYQSRPYNLACHDLTTYIKPPPNIQSLLGLSLKFCPIPKHTHSNYSDSHQRFLRDIYIKDIFANEPPKSSFNPRLYIRSKWEPQTQNVAPVTVKRTQDFLSSTKVLFTRSRGRQNLLTHQKHVLRSLQRQSDLMIIQCDKNLGPAVIERQAYIRLVFLLI